MKIMSERTCLLILQINKKKNINEKGIHFVHSTIALHCMLLSTINEKTKQQQQQQQKKPHSTPVNILLEK